LQGIKLEEQKPGPQKNKDDYIPYPSIDEVVEKGGPYPLIVLPQFGGYWIEDPENVGTPTSLGSSICEEEEEDSFSPSTFGYKLECKSEARAYRRHFLGKDHLNFYCTGSSLGNLLLSIKCEEVEGIEYLRIILRSKVKTVHERIPLAGLSKLPSIPQIAKAFCDDAVGLKFSPVLYPKPAGSGGWVSAVAAGHAGVGLVHARVPVPTARKRELKCLVGKGGTILAGPPEPPGTDTFSVHDWIGHSADG
ncbi:Rap1 GTPase-activating protein 2, partial [Myotis davidii]